MKKYSEKEIVDTAIKLREMVEEMTKNNEFSFDLINQIQSIVYMLNNTKATHLPLGEFDTLVKIDWEKFNDEKVKNPNMSILDFNVRHLKVEKIYKIVQERTDDINSEAFEVVLFETNDLKEAEEVLSKQIDIFENLIRDCKRGFPNARYFSEEMSDQTYHPNVPIEEIVCINYGYMGSVFRPKLITN